jgi:5-methylcytosine-specific restriction endonuclease McrA
MEERWLGIDFSGSASQWGPRVTNSNVWVADVRRLRGAFTLHDVRRVQHLEGQRTPFHNLADLLKRGGYRAAGIDAPLSIPSAYVPNGRHATLIRTVSAVPKGVRPFPTGTDFLEAVAPGLLPKGRKIFRKCEDAWIERGVPARSSLWNDARPGTSFTAAALALLAAAERPVWPFSNATGGTIVEAFPAAQLAAWNLSHSGYSKSHQEVTRRQIVALLATKIELGPHSEKLFESPDALDAVLSAFAAIAVTENRLAVQPDASSKVEGWIAVHDDGKMKATPSTWDAVFERFARFSSQPCLKASGPQFDRGEADIWLKPLLKQSARLAALLPPFPSDLSQEHIDRVLTSLGHTGTRTAGKRPSAALWKHLFRAIVLFRADYRCYFCGRSAEAGVQLSSGQRVALRLELDHINPRAGGGDDFLLSNIRATCRTCNVARGRMADEDFKAELKSLAAAVLARSLQP